MAIRGDEYLLLNGRSFFFLAWGVLVFNDIDYLYMFFFWEGMGKRFFYEGGFLVFFCFSVLFYRGRGVFFGGGVIFFFLLTSFV